MKVLEEGELDPATWSNSGIGRLNPDGSNGACSACHARHEFSVVQARQPETCGKCHPGPDHPQKEIYEESKHGIQFTIHRAEMDLSSPKWIPGEDFFTGPTCSACHNEEWVDNFYAQYDGLIEIYNEKFAKPGKALHALAKPLLKPAKFSNTLDWIWFELWHHEGRRARKGASMMGPDYTHWHGTYEIAQHFYTRMVPELEHLIEQGKVSGDAKNIKAAKALQAKLDEVLNSDNHRWYLDKKSDTTRIHEGAGGCDRGGSRDPAARALRAAGGGAGRRIRSVAGHRAQPAAAGADLHSLVRCRSHRQQADPGCHRSALQGDGLQEVRGQGHEGVGGDL